MNKEVSELEINELDSVSGGTIVHSPLPKPFPFPFPFPFPMPYPVPSPFPNPGPRFPA